MQIICLKLPVAVRASIFWGAQEKKFGRGQKVKMHMNGYFILKSTNLAYLHPYGAATGNDPGLPEPF